MSSEAEPNFDSIDQAVRAVLGQDRVRSVDTAQTVNDDGAAIIRVYIVYDAKHRPSVSEMEDVVDSILATRSREDAPFPVIDFRDDTDVATVAAE